MKIFEIDTVTSAWQLLPGVAQVLSTGVQVTLDAGFAEALIDIEPAAAANLDASVGGRPVVDVGSWAKGEELRIGPRRFVLLSARQAYVPQPGRKSASERWQHLGLALPMLPVAAPAAAPAAARPRRLRLVLVTTAMLAVVAIGSVVVAARWPARDHLMAESPVAPLTSQPVAHPTPPPSLAPAAVATPSASTLLAAPVLPPTKVPVARRAVSRQLPPPRQTMSVALRQELATAIDSAALVGGFDPARAKQELTKIRSRVGQDTELHRRLDRELSRL